MATLVTVCMFCLLCAAHSCYGHDQSKDSFIMTWSKTQYLLEKSRELDNALHHKTKFKDDELDSNISAVKDSRPVLSRAKRAKDSSAIRNQKRVIRAEENVDEDKVYSAALRNVDTNYFVRRIFSQFGDPETMTMNLTGFEQMLKNLELERMIIESANSPKLWDERRLSEEGIVQPSNNIDCMNSVDLVTSLNAQQHAEQSTEHLSTQSHNHSDDVTSTQRHAPSQNMSLKTLKNRIRLNGKTLSNLCPILLYQKIAPTSVERQGCVDSNNFPLVPNKNTIDGFLPEDNMEKNVIVPDYPSNRAAVWIYSSLSIFAISACGLFGVAVIPIMHKSYYQQLLQFLVALAVGTLSGDALMHLLPHAMNPIDHDHSSREELGHESESHTGAHDRSVRIGLYAVIGVVFLYFCEKGLTVVTEWRKRRQKLNKENKLPSRVRVMRDDGSNEPLASTSSHKNSILPSSISLFKSSAECKVDQRPEEQTKICKHKYSEYPYCYDEIATDTKDDHHMHDQASSSPQRTRRDGVKIANVKPSVRIIDKEDNPLLNIASLNALGSSKQLSALEPNEMFQTDDNVDGVQNAKHDSVLKEKAIKGGDEPLIHNNLRDGKNDTVTNNIKNLDYDNKVKIHLNNRSFSVDKGTDMDDLDKDEKREHLKDSESYTVILREHSQAHHGHSHAHGHVHSPPSSLSSVAWMVVMGDGLHNFTDGMAIGAAFSGNIAGGFSTAIAVLCHELPHELGDFAVLLKAGMSIRRAVCYNILSSGLCLLGMIVGICAGHTAASMEVIFAFASGMFLYIALVDMIPELSSSHSKEGSFCQCLLQFLGLVSGIGIMLLIAMYEHDLKSLF